MISRREFPPCKKAFIRQENDRFLLYHGDTGALIELGEDPLKLLEGPDAELRQHVYSTLAEQGFIDDEEGVSAAAAAARRFTRDELKEIDYHFGSLRSHLSPLSVLWGVGGHCNLRCIYCFPDIIKSAGEPHCELTTEEAFTVARKIVDAAVLEVTLSGGEPLMRKDIFDIAQFLHERNLSLSMMTNGTLIKDEQARRMAELDLSVGISLDSLSDEVNRITRGPGVVEKVKRAVDLLCKHGVDVNLVVTLTRHNFDGLRDIFTYAKSMKMESITVQDLRGFGSRELYDQTRLTDTQEDAIPALIDELEAEYQDIYMITSELLMYKHREMPCPAGGFSLYINPRGDLFPCTSLPTFNMGNAVRDDIVQAWQSSEAVTRLRQNKSKTPGSCTGCDQLKTCGGGCRSDPLFYTGDWNGIPSRCPRNRCAAHGSGAVGAGGGPAQLPRPTK